MKGTKLLWKEKNAVALSLFLTLILFLPSCSTVEQKPPSITKCVLPPSEPSRPEYEGVPYCAVDFNFPLSAVSNPSLYVLKKDRRLLVLNDGVIVRDYKIGLGPNPSGDKLFQGDGRTPEGEFFICKKNASSKFYKSLGLNYPSPKHAWEALNMGIISPGDYKNIVKANENMTLPPYNTKLGGAIFIHGGGNRFDWTEGCIALNNSSMVLILN